MTAFTRNSTNISNLNSIPVVPNTTGEYGPGFLRSATGHVAAVTSDGIGSIYDLVRIPTNAKVKQVYLTNAALSASTAMDIDVAYSSSTQDQTIPNLQGTIVQVSAADNKLFGSAVAMTSAQKNQDQTFANTFTTDNQNNPLWSVLGLASDPGGMFDIVLKVTTAVVAGGDVAIEVRYVE